MASPTEIANLALTHIGAEGTLVSIDDQNKAGRLCKKHYDMSRRSVLEMHPWKFASGRVALSPNATAPAFEYAYAFELPADCLRVRLVNDHDSTWVVEGRQVLCGYSAIQLKYTKDELDSSLFSAQFCDALALHLASKIAYALTQSNEREDAMKKALTVALRMARFSDAVQNSPDSMVANDYDAARLGGEDWMRNVTTPGA